MFCTYKVTTEPDEWKKNVVSVFSPDRIELHNVSRLNTVAELLSKLQKASFFSETKKFSIESFVVVAALREEVEKEEGV